jgi:hypothetical protein
MKRLLICVAGAVLLTGGCSTDEDSDAERSADSSAPIAAPTTTVPFTVPTLGASATDDQLITAALAAQNTISCPAFGGDAACVESAGTAGEYLTQIQSAVRNRDGWTVVYNRASDGLGAIDLLSGDCVTAQPGTGDAKLVAACLNASEEVKLIHEEITGAIAEVRRQGG